MKRKLLLCLFALIASATAAMAQVTVSGVVKDSDGPVIGASVVLKGTSNGVTTDVKGEFKINVPNPGSAVLEIRFVGNQPIDYPLEGKTSGIEITMQPDAMALDDVVVIGYGNAIRANLTGSVGSVSGAALERVPVASAAEALVGKVAGVQVTLADGAPGSEVNIRIRGGTSITQSNDPLFIVDGFPAANINDIPPTDIQSIDILKDASLTAIYGAKGGNGVVIVTTKAAKAGKVNVNFNHTTQVRMLARKIEVMNPYQFVKSQWEFAVNDSSRRYKFRGNFGNPLDFDLYKRFGSGNDWQDEILGGTAMSYMYNLTVGGGSENLKFNTSITHNEENGVLVGSGVMRTNLNTKISANLGKNVKLLFNPRFNYRQDKGAGADNVGSGGIIDVLRYRPTNGLRDFANFDPLSVDPDEDAYFEYTNPKGDIEQNYNLKNTYEIINQASLEWTILKGLVFRTEGSLGLSFRDDNRFWGWITSEAAKHNKLPVARIQDRRTTRYTWTNTLSYGFSKDLHNFSFLAGQEIQHYQQKYVTTAARYFPKEISPEKALANLGLGQSLTTTSSLSSPERTASFFGQANYNYDQKYLVSFTFRADGSTKFSPDNRWGYFPAVSAGWVLSKESFMQNQNLFSLLKLRVAIGTAGNNRISDDMWREQYVNNLSADSPVYGPGWGTGESGTDYYAPAGGNTFHNTNIKWETTLTRNLALDIELFNGRLSITPEAYWNTTKDLLYESPLLMTTGYTKQMQNIGQVTNRGFELTVNGTILQKQDLYLSGNLTFGLNKTRVDKLNGEETYREETSSRWKSSDNDYRVEVGKPIGLIYGYEYDGIYSFDDFDRSGATFTLKEGVVNNDAMYGSAPGRPKFKNNTDSDGTVNIVNENDRVVIGDTTPKFSGGFGFNGGWKNFDFNINFTYMYGFDVNNATRYTLMSYEGNANKYYNLSTDMNEDKRWVYSNAVGDQMNSVNFIDQYLEANADKTMWNPRDVQKKFTHSYFIEDGSFLRLQDVTIGYTLPKRLTDKIHINRLRVYVSGYNLWLWTKYTGYDPEVDVQSGLTPGVDYNRYPRSRNIVFGVNLTF